MQIDLKQKRAVICGSSQGIGRAIAEQFAASGASVTLIARNRERLEQVRDALLTDHDQQHQIVVADFSNPAELESQINSWVQSNQTAHILVNNTGGPPAGTALAASTTEFVDAFNQHLVCNHVLVQALVPGMQAAGYGRIINVTSISAREPIANLAVSNTIRAAVSNWAKTLSSELASDNITVNNLLPGMTATERLRSLIAGRAENEGRPVSAVTAEFENAIPTGRFADPAEIASVATFLASPLASYVNGINVTVDGGRSASI